MTLATGHVPDGRVAPIPMVPAVAYIYLALMVGIVPTSGLLVVMALALRRPVLGFGGLLVGGVGFLAPLVPVVTLNIVGGDMQASLPFSMFAMRLMAVGLGYALYRFARPYVRGHLFLGGQQIGLMMLIGPAIAAVFLLPWPIKAWMQFPILMLLPAS